MKTRNNQEQLLEKYGISNYTNGEDGVLTINGGLYLGSLTSIPDKDFLKGTTINGGLNLNSLTKIPDKDFLKGTTINGSLYLSSLTSIPDKDFLKGTTINGWLHLSSLTGIDRNVLNNNIKKLVVGYNEKGGYCFFDSILSKVLHVTKKKGYTIYTTPFHVIAERGGFTAHGITLKKAIGDLEFKMVTEKLKKEPIKPDTMIDWRYYRAVTGACELGINEWKTANGIKAESVKAKELLPILKKTNAYGFESFSKLVTF